MTLLRSSRSKLARIVGALMLALVAGTTPAALACDTPVYRYAMYRWQSADYEVYHFHTGEVTAEFAAAQEKLLAARELQPAPTNVNVWLVNETDDPELKTVPRDVRELRKKHTATPLTLIVNPAGFAVFHGDFSAVQAEAMLVSPVRDQIAKLLAAGHAGVYLLLDGNNAQLNTAARTATTTLVDNVNSGKVSLYRKEDAAQSLASARANNNASLADASDAPAAAIAMLALTRKDLAQQDPWLLSSLLAVEGDLHEFADEPMLFVVYGRGRALPPYIGKGITYDNLVDITDFITNACSCTVKEQNPGVDLLMTTDWQSAAIAVAKRFGAEEGTETLAELFPELLATTSEEPPAAAETPRDGVAPTSVPVTESDPSSDTIETNAANTVTSPADNSKTAANTDGEAVERNEIIAAIDERYAPREEEAAVAAVPAVSTNLSLKLALGLAVGFIALLAVTLVVLRPR